MFFKVSLILSLILFLFVGFLLLANHPGIAINITNYVYFLLAAGVVVEILTSDLKRD